MALLESEKIPVGTPAADFSLQGIDDRMHSLAEYKDAKVLAVVFTCNHCPYAQAVWPRLIALQAKYAGQSVRFVGINANINPEFPDDSFEKMKEYAGKIGINFPYLQDPTQQTARIYTAQCTPDIYVYDAERKLAYHGRVDDNWKEPEKVTKRELDEALAALVKGEKPANLQYPSMGCSIKFRD